MCEKEQTVIGMIQDITLRVGKETHCAVVMKITKHYNATLTLKEKIMARNNVVLCVKFLAA